MKKRRKSPIKKSMRRRGPGLLLTLFCIAVILAAILAAVTVFFKVKKIEVLGDSRYTDEQIIKALNIQLDENMFLVNKFSAIERVYESCPYLDEIVVRRKLPDTLEVTVTDAVAVLNVSSQGKGYIADIKGKILEENPSAIPDGVCTLTGVELFEPKVGKKLSFLETEKENPLFSILNIAKDNDILKDIDNINLEKIYEIQIGYMGRFSVLLGTVEELERKVKVLTYVISELGDGSRGVIDVTDPAKVYFRPYSQ